MISHTSLDIKYLIHPPENIYSTLSEEKGTKALTGAVAFQKV